MSGFVQAFAVLVDLSGDFTYQYTWVLMLQGAIGCAGGLPGGGQVWLDNFKGQIPGLMQRANQLNFRIAADLQKLAGHLSEGLFITKFRKIFARDEMNEDLLIVPARYNGIEDVSEYEEILPSSPPRSYRCSFGDGTHSMGMLLR